MNFSLYYILSSHDLQAYRTVLVCLIICCSISVVGWFLKNKNRTAWNLSGVCWIALWGYIVVVFTMLGRRKAEQSQVELRLFWCIKEAWLNRDTMDWYLIVGNISLFIPLGVMLTVFFSRLRNWWKVMICGLVSSLSIEIAQLILHLGLFELDDLFHNTLGTYLGYCLCVIGLYVIGKDGRKKMKRSFIVACMSWIAVFTFFGVAIAMGQPVFGWLGL